MRYHSLFLTESGATGMPVDDLICVNLQPEMSTIILEELAFTFELMHNIYTSHYSFSAGARAVACPVTR